MKPAIARRLPALFACLSCLALLVQGPSAKAEPGTDPVPVELARQVAQRTIELVETKALRPRRDEEYRQARTALLASLDAGRGTIARGELASGINAMLRTLDVDGHSFIVSPTGYQARQHVAAAPAARPSSLALVASPAGTVLRWTPPAIVSSTLEARAEYVRHFHEDAANLPGAGRACALVIDLSRQTGGNAWPPFIAMHPLFSEANRAAMVDRDGDRRPFVNPAYLARLEAMHAGGRANPLARFAQQPLAVIVGNRTSSAGEMLLVALLGEGERTRTFGRTSHGMSTANVTYPMADGSALVLTEKRYAVGDAPVFRGGIPAMQPAPADAAPETIVQAAADWAALHSRLCQPTGPMQES